VGGATWSGVCEAYRRSFAGLCAGTIDVLVADTRGPEHLDVGCGTGDLALHAARAGRHVTAVDPVPEMVARTRETTRGLDVVAARGGLPDLPLPGDRFDGVTANFVINHVPDPRAAVRELARVVRGGGSVAVTVWTDRPTAQARLFSQSLAAADAIVVPGLRPDPDLDFERSLDGLAGILRQAGLVPRVCRELVWDWEVPWESLWAGIAAGVASIGAAYLAQTDTVRRRIEEEMHERARALEVDGLVHLPSRAAYVLADKALR